MVQREIKRQVVYHEMYEDTVDETHDDIFHVNVLGENDTKIVDAGSAQVS